MAHTSHISHHTEPDSVHVNRLGSDAPAKWLIAAWHDLRTAPLVSLAYGFIFALSGAVLLWFVADTQYLVIALVTGFLLLGPFLAIGLYHVSHQIEQGKKASLWQALTAWRHRADNIMMIAIIPGIVMAAWVRFSALLVGFYFNQGVVIGSETFITEMFLSRDALMFWLTYVSVGALLAAFIFTITAVSIPLSMDKNIDCISAMAISYKAVMQNKAQMLLWAMAIVVMTMVGFLTLGIGLIVTMPLIAYASWHAYRDLVVAD